MNDQADPPEDPVSDRSRIDALLNGLPGGRLVRQAYIVIGGTAIAQALLISAAPILARQYSREEFGVLAVFLSLVSVGFVVGSLRFEQAVALPDDDDESLHVVVVAVLASLFTAFVAAVALWVWGDELAEAVNLPALEGYLWAIPPTVIVAGLYQTLGLWRVRNRRFKRISAGSVAQGGSLVGIQVGAGLLGAAAGGLLFGPAVGWMAGSVVLAYRLLAGTRARWSAVTWAGLYRTAGRYRRFPMISVWSGLLNRGALEVPAIALTILYGPAVAGLFLLGRRMMVAPAILIGTSVQHVYLGEAARLVRTDPPRLEALYRRTWQRLLLLGLAPTVILAVAAPVLFSFVFGPEWREAGVFASILAPVFLLQITVTPLASTYAILERQDLQLLRDLVRAVLVVGGFVVAGVYDLEARVAVALFSVAMSIGYLFLFVLGSREVRKHREAWERDGQAFTVVEARHSSAGEN